MNLTELFIAEVDRETERTRRVVANVPTGKDDWKPHEKSMALGRLAGLVASMPSWISLALDQDELDLTPPPGAGQYQQPSTDQLVSTLETLAAKARVSLQARDDDYLFNTKWRLKAGGAVVLEDPRHIVLRDTINHWSHHRGQLTVYLRLVGAPVPAVYGPSADDKTFR